jgi:hypothetical protein
MVPCARHEFQIPELIRQIARKWIIILYILKMGVIILG